MVFALFKRGAGQIQANTNTTKLHPRENIIIYNYKEIFKFPITLKNKIQPSCTREKIINKIFKFPITLIAQLYTTQLIVLVTHLFAYQFYQLLLLGTNFYSGSCFIPSEHFFSIHQSIFYSIPIFVNEIKKTSFSIFVFFSFQFSFSFFLVSMFAFSF